VTLVAVEAIRFTEAIQAAAKNTAATVIEQATLPKTAIITIQAIDIRATAKLVNHNRKEVSSAPTATE
jgi:hypothetical protein